MKSMTDYYWDEKYDFLFDKAVLQRRPVYSDHGENNILEIIFRKFPPLNKYLVDIGCRGQSGSNSLSLIEQGWKGILIDFDTTSLNEMREITKDRQGVTLLDIFVTPKKPNNLDKILHQQEAPKELDFLSIDTDSFEYEIWENLKDFTPNVVCIEINQGLQGDFETIDYEPSGTLWKYNGRLPAWSGATIGLTNKVAEDKGYDYLCLTGPNAFYLRKDFVNGS